MSEWQPIATAPKEEMAQVLLFARGVTLIGWWQAEIPSIPARWEECEGGFEVKPTHWMPLPAPPVRTP